MKRTSTAHLDGELFLDLAQGRRPLTEVLTASCRHLGARCPLCRGVLADYPDLAAGDEAGQGPVGLAVERVAEATDALRREHDEAVGGLLDEILDAPLEQALDRLVSSPRLGTWGVAAALLDDATDSVRWGPATGGRMVAALAAVVAMRLSTGRYPAWVVEDLRSATRLTSSEALLRCGAYAEAEEELAAAEEHRRRGSGVWVYQGMAELGRGRWDLAAGRPRRAAQRAGRVLTEAAACEDPAAMLEAAGVLAAASADTGGPEVALKALELGGAAWTACDSAAAQWPVALRLEVARAYVNCGAWDEALDEIAIAERELPRLHFPLLRPRLERLRGVSFQGLGRIAAAERSLDAAWEGSLDLGEGMESARVGLDRALLFAAEERPDAFRRSVEGLAEVLRLDTLPAAAAVIVLRFQALARREGPDPARCAEARERLYGLAAEQDDAEVQ